MKRSELEHLIRAAAAVTDQYEIVVVGSQSVLGAVPDAPAVLLQSREADCYPLHRPDLADVIDGAIGELSPFDERFGYYAQGAGPETAILPVGWESRLVKIQNENTDLKSAIALSRMISRLPNWRQAVTRIGRLSRPCSSTRSSMARSLKNGLSNFPFQLITRNG
jgi:hypothetical protein